MRIISTLKKGIIKNNVAKVHYFIKNTELGIVKDKIEKSCYNKGIKMYLLFNNKKKLESTALIHSTESPAPLMMSIRVMHLYVWNAWEEWRINSL